MNTLKQLLATPVFCFLLCNPALAAPGSAPAGAVNAIAEKEIPSSNSMFYYSIGGGNLTPKPANFEKMTPFKVNFKSESHFSCGKFGMEHNLKDLMDQFDQLGDKLRGALVSIVEGTVAALPGYLLNKTNPALYHTLNRSLDETYELFRLNVKSCEDIERDMIRSGSVFGGLVGATVADGYRDAADKEAKGDTSERIDEVSDRVRGNAGSEGVQIFGTTKKGGAGQDPIRINFDTSLAGYNLLTHLGAITDPLAEGKPSGTGKTTLTDADGNTKVIDYPIISMWGTAKKAADWITDVTGEQHVKIANNAADPANIKSKPGRGLRPHIYQHTFEIRKAISEAVVDNKYANIRKPEYSDIFQIGFPVVDAIRTSSPYEQSLLMDRLSSELAVNYVLNKAIMARRILYAGAREASLGMSSGGQIVTKHIRTHTLPNLNDSIDEVLKDIDIREKTVAKTPIKILQHASDIKTRGAGSETPNMAPDKPIVDGQVEK